MRAFLMLCGLVLVGLAGLWFFTSTLDQTYSRHAPGIAHSRSDRAGAASRPSSSAPRANAPSAASASPIASKNVLDNLMSMINVGTGLLGLWFGWMSYRMQKREFDRRS